MLEAYQQEIVLAWVEAVYQVPDSPYVERPPQELRASVMRGLNAVMVALTTESHVALNAYLNDTYVTRAQMGISVSEVIQVLLLCRNAVLPIVWQVHAAEPDVARALASQVDVVICWMTSDLTELYITSESRILKEQQARTAMVLDMVRIATSTLDLDQVLAHVADRIAVALGVQDCGFFLVDEEMGTITPKLDVTVAAIRSARAGGTVPSSSLPKPIATYSALVREVVGQQEPSFCFNVQTDPRFDTQPLRELGYKSVLAIPFIVKGRVVAVAFALTLEDCRSFTDEQIELAHSLADASALAIENARLYQQMEQLAVTRERSRLSREIHDDLAPTLGALQLIASMASDQLENGQVAEAEESIRDLQTMISEAYTDMREEIFNLRASTAPGRGFMPILREYLEDYRVHYGMEIQLEAEERDETALAGSAQVQVIRIVQESLTNVRKHARTNRARVCVEHVNAHVRISVHDEGQGFDPTRVVARGRQYVGLQVMRERAESIGGTLTLESRPGVGTVVVLDVPLAGG